MKGRDSGGLGVGVRAGRGLPPGARVLNTVLTGPSGTGEQQAARRTGSLPPLKTQLLSLIRSHLFLFLFPLLWEVGHRGSCCDLRQRVCCLFSSRSFIGSMHEMGCSGLVHWDDPEGWEGASGSGTHVHPWLIHVNVWQKPLQYCKVISLQ